LVKRAAPKDAKGRLNTAAAKEAFLERLAIGESVTAAVRHVGRTEKGYEYWRRSDASFKLQCDTILGRRHDNTVYEVPDFPEFCAEYLHQPLFDHQLRWWDVLCGREPRDLHPTMKWFPGDRQMLLFNVPPGFGKSITLTTNYVVWRICKDPNVRILIVSATHHMAQKFLHAVKVRLSNPAYADLQRKFGPQGGFKETADSWTQNEIYLGSADSGEKDPTVQAIGMGGQIYGARADLIVVDDAVLLKNAHQFEDQIDWLTQEVVTRLPEGEPDAKLIVVGTRVAPVDLYSKLRDDFRDEDDNSVFTYFAQPAVLEYADDPKDWVSLWPQTTDRDGNLVPKWPGPYLKKRRDKVRPRIWAMVYQQLDEAPDGIFDPALVHAAIEQSRPPGPLMPGDRAGQRPEGMKGLYVVAGLDPATAGHTAAVVMAVSRHDKRMWVLEVFNREGVLPRQIRDLIQTWTIKYGVDEWVIEENAFQRFLVQDDDVREFLFSRGVILRGHHTHRGNKSDPDFGVASMSTLFEPLADGKPTLLLPSLKGSSHAVAALVEQLIAWQPDVKGQKTDCVMALWFAVLRARKIIFQAQGRQRTHMPNQFLSSGRASRERQVVNLIELEQQRAMEEAYR
jgi:hypothetical protein